MDPMGMTPTQTMHYETKEIRQNHHIFAACYLVPPKMGGI